MYILKYGLLILSVFFTFTAWSQEGGEDSESPVEELKREAKEVIGEIDFEGGELINELPVLRFDSSAIEQGLDSLDLSKLQPIDTSRVADDALMLKKDSAKKEPQGDIETTIKYQARDSIFFDVEKQKVYLYGDSKINYDRIDLEAELIEIDYSKNIVYAKYALDTAGKKIGKPIFSDGTDTYYTDNMKYHFKNKKAIITGIVTQQGDAFMHGEKVKKNKNDELYINKARYTTCDLEEPHFHISSTRIKVIPGNKVISGPFNVHFNNIPTPMGFAFGMFPEEQKKTSGIVVPSYGEERLRGFFLRDGGYYWAVNDNIDLSMLGEIYSKGGHGLNLSSSYKKRYSHSGMANFRYNRFTSGQEVDSLFINDFWVKWSHTPETKGNSRFSANVNAGTSTYNQNMALDVARNTNTNFSSNVSYSKTFAGTPFNMAVNLRHNQNVRTNQVNLTLPDLNFSMARQYPFKGLTGNPNSVIEKINFSHNFAGRVEVSNAPIRAGNFIVANRSENMDSLIGFNFANASQLLQRARMGGRHTVPVSTTFNMLKYFAVNPNFNLTELWYPSELSYTFVPEQNAVRIDTLNQFSRAYHYNMGASVNTRLYGTVYLNRDYIQAIRHQVIPSLSFSYNPDFSTGRFDYFQEVQVDTTGRSLRLSKYEGYLFGTPPGGMRNGTMGFSLANNLEMKVKDRSDSTGKSTKKVKIFDNLSISSGYNLLADSMKLQPINFTLRTRVFNNAVDINFNGSMDPYRTVLDTAFRDTQGNLMVQQRRIDQFAWDAGEGIGQLTRANLAIGFSLNPDTWKGDKTNGDGNGNGRGVGVDEAEMDFINAHPDLYVDFNIPWNLRVSFNVNYTRQGFLEPNITQALTFSGDFSLTDKWKFTYNSGYDFQAQDFTMTNIGIIRDLHCWEMAVDWTPFGRFQRYSLNIYVKSAVLKDLKLSKRRNFFDSL